MKKLILLTMSFFLTLAILTGCQKPISEEKQNNYVTEAKEVATQVEEKTEEAVEAKIETTDDSDKKISTYEEVYGLGGLLGEFIENIDVYPYDDYVIVRKSYIDGDNGEVEGIFVVDSDGNELCQLRDNYNIDNIVEEITVAIENKHTNLQGFTNEKINGELVNYDEYISVIVPMYKGVNMEKLDKMVFNISDKQTIEVSFAVFGKAANVNILYTSNANEEEYTITKVGEINDSLVTIKTDIPTDFSNIIIKCNVMAGEGYVHNVEFSLDGMRDLSEYKPIMISW